MTLENVGTIREQGHIKQLCYIEQCDSLSVHVSVCLPVCNQITVVTFQLVQLTQASFLQKDQKLQNVFLISVTLRWHRASVACKNQSNKVINLIFLVKKLNN